MKHRVLLAIFMVVGASFNQNQAASYKEPLDLPFHYSKRYVKVICLDQKELWVSEPSFAFFRGFHRLQLENADSHYKTPALVSCSSESLWFWCNFVLHKGILTEEMDLFLKEHFKTLESVEALIATLSFLRPVYSYEGIYPFAESFLHDWQSVDHSLRGQLRFMKILRAMERIKKNAKAPRYQSELDTAFCTMVKQGEFTYADNLLAQGASLDAVDWDNSCEHLLWYNYYDNGKTLEYLLSRGANPNIKSIVSSEATPLHHWAQFASLEAEILLRYGAHVNARDKNGDTPLHYCAQKHPGECPKRQAKITALFLERCKKNQLMKEKA